MNANELDKKLVEVAKFIDIVANNWQAIRIIESTRTMLRQQQAREDSLCSMVKEYQDKVDELRTEIEALKAHSVKELNDGGEPVKNATYWKRQYNLMATQNDNLKSGLYHANEQIKYLESHPVKEQLTDEKIADFLYAYCLDIGYVYEVSEEQFIKCVRAILLKAQEK